MARTTSHLTNTTASIFCRETMSYTGRNANHVQTYTPYSRSLYDPVYSVVEVPSLLIRDRRCFRCRQACTSYCLRGIGTNFIALGVSNDRCNIVYSQSDSFLPAHIPLPSTTTTDTSSSINDDSLCRCSAWTATWTHCSTFPRRHIHHYRRHVQ
jgi:hypothetical protein